MKTHHEQCNLTELKREKLILSQKDSKTTVPEIYPSKHLSDCNTPIASDKDVKRAKDWVDFNKL